jgi:NTE family protein
MDKYKSLVIGGAGVKNYASLGAIKNLDLTNIDRLLGVSSGSILATLLAIGCSSEEMVKYFDMVDLSRFKIKYSLCNYYKIYRYGGIHDSSVFREKVIYKILKEKTGNGDITFMEIFEKYGKILVIPSACVNKREMFYYTKDSNPDLEVKYAIEQSCCVPGLFYPIKYKGNTLVDAGIIDNYPLYYFNKDKLPNSKITRVLPSREQINNETLGILIIDDKVSKKEDDPYLGDDDASSFTDYIKCILNTILTTSSRCRIGPGYWENTIAIDIGIQIDGVSDMSLDTNTKKKLYSIGEEEAKKFIEKS